MNVKKRIQHLIDTTMLVSNIATLEKTLGLANGVISHWEHKTPGVNNLIKVSKFFNCSIDYLLEQTDNPTINKTMTSDYNIDDLLSRYLDRYCLDSELKASLETVVLTFLKGCTQKKKE